MVVFFHLVSILLVLGGLALAATLLLPSGPGLLTEMLSRPPALAALILLGSGVGAAFFWTVAELIRRARWATLVLDPPGADMETGGEARGPEGGPAPLRSGDGNAGEAAPVDRNAAD
jgi:hypothetical protein